MKECNCDLRDGDAKTAVFGSNEMLQPAPVDTIPMEPTTPQIAYQMVKDETFAQTQPRLNLATFVTTYMDDYATKLMNEAISINYIDETEYPRIAVMNAKCINIMANLWNSPEQAKWKTGALATPPSIQASLEPIASAPVFHFACSGEFHKLAMILIQLAFITAIRGYSVSSM